MSNTKTAKDHMDEHAIFEKLAGMNTDLNVIPGDTGYWTFSNEDLLKVAEWVKAHAAEARREAERERDGYRFDLEGCEEEGYDFALELVASHKLLALQIEQLGGSDE